MNVHGHTEINYSYLVNIWCHTCVDQTSWNRSITFNWSGGVSKNVKNRSVLDLIRLPSKAKAQMASGQGSHWFIESPNFSSMCNLPTWRVTPCF